MSHSSRPLVPLRGAVCVGSLILSIGGLRAQQLFEAQEVRTDFAAGAPSNDDVLVDLDGDGRPDLVRALKDGGLRYQSNVGEGLFVEQTAARFPVSVQSSAYLCMEAADLDGDGDLDLVTGGIDQAPTVLWNDGTGVFARTPSSGLETLRFDCFTIVAEDFDSDGDVDLYMGVFRLARFFENVGGTFQEATSQWLPVPHAYVSDAVAADINADGRPDLVTIESFDIGIHINAPGGQLVTESAQRLPVFFESVRGIALGDVDGDVDLDIVVGTGDQERDFVLPNDGNGVFGRPVDMLGSNGVRTARGESVALLDVTGDGLPEVFFARGQSSPRRQEHWYFTNTGSLRFSDSSEAQDRLECAQVQRVLMGDVDADGTSDLMFTGDRIGLAGAPCIAFNNGNGDFTMGTRARLPLEQALYYRNAVSGDLDGDGDIDLITGRRPRVLIQEGGFFRDETAGRLPSGEVRDRVRLLDVDGDGDLDLCAMVANTFTRGLEIFLNDGAGVFAQPSAVTSPRSSFGVRDLVGLDADGDGDLDLALACQDRTARLWINRGPAGFADVSGGLPSLAGQPGTHLAARDFDADGVRDLMVITVDSGAVFGSGGALWLGNGDGTFRAGPRALPRLGGTPSSVSVADLDLDGDDDVLIGRVLSDPASSDRVLRNDGSGRFSDVSSSWLAGTSRNSRVAVFRDVDEDGDPDLICAEWSADQRGPVRYYLNDGQGRLGSGVTLPVEPAFQTDALVVEDLDGDGDVDVAALGLFGHAVLQGLTRQLHAPLPARIGRAFAYQFDVRGPVLGSGPVLAVLGIAPEGAMLQVPGLGVLRIDPLQTTQIGPVALDPSSMDATFSLRLPVDPALVGVSAHAQALFVGMATGPRFSNAIVSPIGR